MKLNVTVKNFLSTKLLFLCCAWLQVSASGERMDSEYIVDANGHDATQSRFILRIDTFGNDDKWNEKADAQVSIVHVIAVAEVDPGIQARG